MTQTETQSQNELPALMVTWLQMRDATSGSPGAATAGRQRGGGRNVSEPLTNSPGVLRMVSFEQKGLTGH